MTAIRDTSRANGSRDYFFTDDDFARNPHWQALFDALIRLREDEGLPLRFLMQADLLAQRIPGFVDGAARAGCFQVFLGMESLNPESLRAAGKRTSIRRGSLILPRLRSQAATVSKSSPRT